MGFPKDDEECWGSSVPEEADDWGDGEFVPDPKPVPAPDPLYISHVVCVPVESDASQ